MTEYEDFEIRTEREIARERGGDFEIRTEREIDRERGGDFEIRLRGREIENMGV